MSVLGKVVGRQFTGFRHLVMMLNYPVRQKEGVREEEEEEEASGRRKGVQTGTSTLGAGDPTGSTWLGVSNARSSRKPGLCCGVKTPQKAYSGLGIIPILSQ